MKINSKLKTIATLLIGVFLFGSCASTTVINSYPSGARVYLNGEPVGKTPYRYTDTKVVGTYTNIKLVKEGYVPLFTSFSRSEQANVGAIIGGMFFLVPWLWVMDYKPTHTYELMPIQNLETEESFMSKEEQLRKLRKLFEEQLISEDEYYIEKQKVLNNN